MGAWFGDIVSHVLHLFILGSCYAVSKNIISITLLGLYYLAVHINALPLWHR